ncbi:esterase FrsA [Vibrio kasasachensis]|uniref:alpha/beta hydrolase n=1 Tax=Vibrio kasasachensis TaxID=2910248 RepID=UPI003D0CBCB2
MKKLLLSSLIACSLASPVMAEDANMTAHQAFKANLSEVQNQFYRSLRLEEWIAMGLAAEDFTATVTKLSAGKEGLVDLENYDRPGYWTYEFTQIAKNAELNAIATNNAQAYDRASVSYLVASYPNLQRPNELQALDKAVDLYIKATNLHGIEVVKVDMMREDGRSVPGLLHIPKQKKAQAPAIMWSGGVDKTLIEHRKSITPLLNEGYVVLTFDMPGAGLDYRNHVEIGNESASHDAAFNFLSNNKLVDSNRIGVLGSSGVGPALMDFALKQNQLKAIVARCALVDGPIGNPETLKYIPKMSADSFIARIGGDIGDMEYFKIIGPRLSLKNKGLFDGKTRIETPLLAINTKKDPIAMPEDVKKTAALSTKGEVYISEEYGHCPDAIEADEKIINFLLEKV